jgi:hypothetical protein
MSKMGNIKEPLPKKVRKYFLEHNGLNLRNLQKKVLPYFFGHFFGHLFRTFF